MGDPLFVADCLDILPCLPEGCARLIYLDPPFNTHTRRSANSRRAGAGEVSYPDQFGPAEAYIAYLRPRLEAMRRVLAPDGSLFFHCDWRMSPHVRTMLDGLFQVFVNEIIWHYGLGAARARRRLLSKHDVIYWHAASPGYVFNLLREEATPAMLDKYRHVDEQGRRYMNSYGRRYFLQGGKPLDDVWDIPAIAPTSKERAGYPTQKPLALLRRIVELASQPGDLVLDPFCGSGTTPVAAQELGRRWIGIDANPQAIAIARQRLSK
jgi:site-specific DNA-methyltransferase (adenine-specific)